MLSTLMRKIGTSYSAYAADVWQGEAIVTRVSCPGKQLATSVNSSPWRNPAVWSNIAACLVKNIAATATGWCRPTLDFSVNPERRRNASPERVQAMRSSRARNLPPCQALNASLRQIVGRRTNPTAAMPKYAQSALGSRHRGLISSSMSCPFIV